MSTIAAARSDKIDIQQEQRTNQNLLLSIMTALMLPGHGGHQHLRHEHRRSAARTPWRHRRRDPADDRGVGGTYRLLRWMGFLWR